MLRRLQQKEGLIMRQFISLDIAEWLKDIPEKAEAGIFLTFGENFLYLITSGILAFVVAEKDYKKKNGNIRMDKEQ